MRSAAAHPLRVVPSKAVGTRHVSPLRRIREASALRRMPTLRKAGRADAEAIHALVMDHLSEGHLLPRQLDDIQAHVDRFVVAANGSSVVACAELSPLSASVAEVRSLVVSEQARKLGIGQAMVNELSKRAIAAGFKKLCAFAHAPAYFVHMGFSIIPHTWLPEKIEKDCRGCVQFRTCGQYAVVRDLCQ